MKRFKCFAVAWVLILALVGSVRAGFDTNEVVKAVDAFVIRQMEFFDSVRPLNQPPLVQTYGWDTNLPFPPPQLNPPPCCNQPCAGVPLWQMAYRGDTYDQSLAAIWFTERAWNDFINGIDGRQKFARARRLLDALIFLEEHDPCSDGRVRAAYWANNLLDPSGTHSSIMDPDAGTGNIAWFGISLTRFCYFGRKTGYLDPVAKQHYIDIAKEKGDWVIGNCTDSWPCGFTGGYSGWGQIRYTWKSTEHNIDVFVFAKNLYYLTGEQKWSDMAERASCFIKSMYVENALCGHYLTGTLADGITPNTSIVPADAQSWTALARFCSTEIDTDARALCAMQWLLANLKDSCECGTIVLPYDGVKFADVGKNTQCEMTASAAMALTHLVEEPNEAQKFYELLEWIRVNAAPAYDGIADGNGIVATPCPEGAWTGYGSSAWYYKLLHVASSVWTGLSMIVAQGHKSANPLIPLGDDTPPDLSVSVTPSVLWPPNHKMTKVTPVWTVSDNCDGSPQVRLTGITVNENEQKNTFDPAYDIEFRDGYTSDDIRIDPDGSIWLRAERSDNSSRVYTITYEAVDDFNNSTIATATVTVPHSRP